MPHLYATIVYGFNIMSHAQVTYV